MAFEIPKISAIIPFYPYALYIQEVIRRIAILKETLVRK